MLNSELFSYFWKHNKNKTCVKCIFDTVNLTNTISYEIQPNLDHVEILSKYTNDDTKDYIISGFIYLSEDDQLEIQPLTNREIRKILIELIQKYT